jgi:hypothetical protein
MSAVVRERIVRSYRSGLFVHWEARLSGGGPVLRGTTWTKRGAARQAAKAGVS